MLGRPGSEQPAAIQASIANGLAPASQRPAPDWLNVEMGGRTSSSLGHHVPDAWPSSTSNIPAPSETSVRPPPRAESIDSTSPYQTWFSNVPGSAGQVASPRKSPTYNRRPTPTAAPPHPPADAQPYLQSPPSFAPGNHRNVPTGGTQISALSQVPTPSRFLPVTGGGVAPHDNTNTIPASTLPAAQGPRLLSPRTGSSPKQLIGARSFDNLRGSTRPLPIGPKQTPTPIQTSGLANQVGSSGAYTQTPTTSSASPTSSPVGPLVAGIGTRKQGDTKRRDGVYTKRPSVGDSSVEGPSRLVSRHLLSMLVGIGDRNFSSVPFLGACLRIGRGRRVDSFACH